MRATRSTTLGFGMVLIPVKMYKITESRRLEKDIHMVHTVCGTRVKMPKYCPECEKLLDNDDLVKGYFLDKANYVPITAEDYERLPLSSLKSVDIQGFIAPITDRRWFNGDIYAIAPDQVGAKAFVLFMSAMTELGVWGIAKMASRDKEQLVTIMPSGDGIMFIQTLHWGSELRDYDELVPYADVSEKELEMGKAIIKAMTKPINLYSFEDAYGKALAEMIAAKMTGQELAPIPAPKQSADGDLVDQLMSSLKALETA